MSDKKRVTAAVLVIGNEILSGRTHDANLPYLGRELNLLGIQMREARVVADIESEIIDALNACRAKYDYVFTCLLYTSPSPRDATLSRMPSSA